MGLIAFDCDGVLAEFTKGLLDGLKARGFSREESTIRHWDLSASLTQDENALVDEIVSCPGFCAGLAKAPGMSALVRALRAGGHDVFVATSPYPSRTWIDERKTWLSDVFPASDVMFASSKRKPLIAADILVEDHPGTASAWCERHPDGVAILIDRPWNSPAAKEFWPHSRMYRAHNIAEVFDLCREFA